MSDFSVKKKLELMQQVRSRYKRDKNDLFQREKILYGRTSPVRDESIYTKDYDAYEDYPENGQPQISTFQLRLFLAVAIFALLVLSDRTGTRILGLTAEKCFQAISADYESSIAAWADAASNAISIDKKDTDYDDRPLKDNPPAGVRP